jgi:hypothetical protein
MLPQPAYFLTVILSLLPRMVAVTRHMITFINNLCFIAVDIGQMGLDRGITGGRKPCVLSHVEAYWVTAPVTAMLYLN